MDFRTRRNDPCWCGSGKKLKYCHGPSYEDSTNDLRPHQEQAVSIAFDLLTDGKRKVLLELVTGTGKTSIMVELTERLFKSGIIHKALILTDTRMTADQIAATFYKSASYLVTGVLNAPGENQIAVLTYSKLRAQANADSIKKFDLIICNEAQYTKDEKIEHFFQNSSSMFVGIISSDLAKKQILGWFRGVPSAFRYSIVDSIKDGYSAFSMRPQAYGQAVEGFCSRLLQQHGYDVIAEPKLGTDTKFIYPDLLVSSGEKRIILEIKAYRGRYASKNVIDTAVRQILKYKSILEYSELPETTQNFIYCLVLFCEIDHEQKEQLFEQYGITIWDIANLLYVCGNNSEFSRELSELLYFPIADIVPEEPYGWMPQRLALASEISEPSTQSIAESLEEQLRSCKVGKEKKAAAEYECICTEIIRFLFDSEFTQSSNQHKTGDDLFRMDLLCGIKGSSVFWELLIRHYNTRFVVFEYKNYSTCLPQNLIYTTEKYLFDAALRNVAIIVSRKGFSQNARIAALGCLKESGKLVIDLTDEDLILMLHKKIDGEESSDYLLWKLENLLMAVSK